MRLNGNITLNALGQSEIQNLFVERTATLPVHNSSFEGRIVYNLADNKYYLNDGVAWAAVGTGGSVTSLNDEVDAIETALGNFINGATGAWDGTSLNALNNVSGANDLVEVLIDLDAAISSADTFAEMTDVNMTGLADNQFAQYSTSTSNWEPHTLVLASVTDVTASATEVNYTSGVTSAIQTQLDDEATTRGDADTALTGRVDDISGATGAGLTSDSYVTNGATTYLTTATNLVLADEALDAALDAEATARASADGTHTTDISNRVENAGDTMDSAANLTFVGGGEILGLPATPTQTTSAASKIYVDNLVASATTWQKPIECPNFVDVASAEPVSPVQYVSVVKYGGTQAESWTGVASVSDNDILEWDGAAWASLGTLAAGTRFAVAVEVGTVGTNLSAAGIRAKDLIEYASGDPSTPGSWTLPHDYDHQALWFSVSKATGDATGLADDATVYDATVDVNGTPNAVSIVGSAAQTFSTLLSEINADLTGATATIDNGHIHITGNATSDTILLTHGVTVDLFAALTDFSEIRGSIDSGTTTLAHNQGCAEYGHTYLYSHVSHNWTEISGPGSIGDGVGLTYNGNVLNLNLGAGIIELPTDEVGVDVYATGGLLTTLDGTTSDTTTNARLAIKLDGTTLALSASGLALSSTTSTAISTNTTNIGTEITNRTNADTALGTRIDNVGAGAGLTGDAYVQTGGANYISGATDLDNADQLLDTQVKANADAISTNAGLVSQGYFLYANAVAGTTHTVTHGIGSQYCTVTVIDHTTGEQVIPQSVVFDTASQLTVTFNSALACRVVVMGLGV